MQQKTMINNDRPSHTIIIATLGIYKNKPSNNNNRSENRRLSYQLGNFRNCLLWSDPYMLGSTVKFKIQPCLYIYTIYNETVKKRALGMLKFSLLVHLGRLNRSTN